MEATPQSQSGNQESVTHSVGSLSFTYRSPGTGESPAMMASITESSEKASNENGEQKNRTMIAGVAGDEPQGSVMRLAKQPFGGARGRDVREWQHVRFMSAKLYPSLKAAVALATICLAGRGAD
jgi:hypothetical protein